MVTGLDKTQQSVALIIEKPLEKDLEKILGSIPPMLKLLVRCGKRIYGDDYYVEKFIKARFSKTG